MATPNAIMMARLNRSGRTKRISSGPPRGPYTDELPFTYEFVSIVSLAANTGGLLLSVTTDQDGDFYWHKGCIFVDVANDGTSYENQIAPNLTVLITDGRTQRNLSPVPVHATNYFGTARMPYILPTPYFFAARTLITMLVANVSDNTAYSSIRISMHGIKRFF